MGEDKPFFATCGKNAILPMFYRSFGDVAHMEFFFVGTLKLRSVGIFLLAKIRRADFRSD